MADILTLKKFEALSPFEIKDELINLAKATSKTTQSAFLNAGRGNPNWVATTPREGFFLLGQFAVTESKRVMEHPAGVGGMPQAAGIAARLEAWLEKHSDMPGADFLAAMTKFAIEKFGFENDAFVHELVDSIIGDNYPVPDRMLVHNERIVHEYLMWAMCGQPHPSGKFDIYAVEGGTAAMCYIFKSLKANRLLHAGDTIALGTPIFTPYLEMTHLEDYDLKVVHIRAPQENRFQYTDEEIKKLEDPKIKAFFVVNPGNPTGMAMDKETIGKITNLVKTKRPDLMLLTDDVYGTFVDDFRSLLGELPQHTIGVYSYSKYFGCTGWRLGTIAVHEDNIYDKMIAKLPDADVKALDKRYGALTLEPRKVKFIDRIVADSRDVALNHTAGLSLPQQVMMSLFSLSEMMDTQKRYQAACKAIVDRRIMDLDRQHGPSTGAERELRRLLRPDRLRVLGPEEYRRRSGRISQEEHPSARSRVPPRRGLRHRPAQRRRLRSAELVAPGVAGEPAGRCLRADRTRCAADRPWLPRHVRGIEAGRCQVNRIFA